MADYDDVLGQRDRHKERVDSAAIYIRDDVLEFFSPDIERIKNQLPNQQDRVAALEVIGAVVESAAMAGYLKGEKHD